MLSCEKAIDTMNQGFDGKNSASFNTFSTNRVLLSSFKGTSTQRITLNCGGLDNSADPFALSRDKALSDATVFLF